MPQKKHCTAKELADEKGRHRKSFECDIEDYFRLTPVGGYAHNDDVYDLMLGLYKDTQIRLIRDSQPKTWRRFVSINVVDIKKV